MVVAIIVVLLRSLDTCLHHPHNHSPSGKLFITSIPTVCGVYIIFFSFHQYRMYSAHGLKRNRQILGRTLLMCNYWRVPCHVASNLVTKCDMDSDLRVQVEITPMSPKLPIVWTKACASVRPKLLSFNPRALYMHTLQHALHAFTSIHWSQPNTRGKVHKVAQKTCAQF